MIHPLRTSGPLIRWDSSENIYRVGARGADFEFMRYLPRRELTVALDECDLVQVVGGSPAIGFAAARSTRPISLQMATFIAWERPSATRELTGFRKACSRLNSPPAVWTERRALGVAAKVFIENGEARDELNTVVSKPFLLHLGVDTDHFVPAQGNTLGRYILSVGRLSESRKGYERMLFAYSELRRILPEAPPLVLAGKGGLAPAAYRLLTQLGLARHVDVRSDVAEADLAPLLQGASVFWMTSYEEGLGLSAVEAIACGVPAVATETAGTRVSVMEEVGALVSHSPFEAAEFAAATLHMLRTGTEMRSAARGRAVEMFDTDVAIRPFLDAYRLALASKFPADILWHD